MALFDDPHHAVMTIVDYIYQIDLLVPEMSVDLVEDLGVVTEVHLTAMKYNVRHLAEASWNRFCHLARTKWVPLWESRQLDPIIRTIYSHSDSHPDIRLAVVDLIAHHRAAFTGPMSIHAFRELLRTSPRLEADLNPRLVEQSTLAPAPRSVPTEISDIMLHILAQANLPDQCRQLLNDGWDIDTRDANGEVPLHYAAFFGNLECVEALVEAGANVNAEAKEYDANPLTWAKQEGHGDVAEYLQQHGAKDNHLPKKKQRRVGRQRRR
jgi:hypothetical protein